MPIAPHVPSEIGFPVPRSPLVGRSRESADLRRLLQRPEVSIITVTGPPGIGKTRLALHVAAEVHPEFADGGCLVALSQLVDPKYVSTQIAEALGLPGDDNNAVARLTSYLHRKQLLLLLDNFEHVIAAAPLIAELVAMCPSIKVLATSREPLRLSCEHDFPLPPLALPDSAELMPLQELAQVDAVAFFAQRASTVNPAFSLSEGNASDVVAICRGLDGLPLAIELAAARTKLLSPAAIRARLANRLLLLTDGPRDQPPRQQSMRDAIAWSYDLLTPDEQVHLRRLSVFVGGFSPEGVERLVRVAEASGDGLAPPAPGRERRSFVPAPSLFRLGASLVDKSLVQPIADGGDQPRFRLLETVREFGLDRLAAAGEETTIRDAHAQAFLTLAETAHPHLRGPEQAAWFTELETEHPNFRAALDWFQERGDLLSAVRLANALGRFWEARGHLSEGRARLRRLLEAAEQAPANAIPELVRARAELWSGTLAHWQGDFADSITSCSIAFDRYVAGGDERGAVHALLRQGQSASFQGHLDHARSLMLESLRRFQDLEDDWGIALARTAIVNPLLEAGELESAEQLLVESLPLARRVKDPDLLAMTLINVGWLASWRGEDARAESALQESRALFLMIGERRTLPYTLNLLGMLAWRHGHHARAASLLCEGLTLSRDLGSQLAIVNSLHALLHVAATEQPALAARLHGAAETVRASIGNPIQPVERPLIESAVEQLREALGEASFRAEFVAGLTSSVDSAIAEGLAFLATLALPALCAEPDPGDAISLLTPRELDVLRHVVEGQTNTQIASALFAGLTLGTGRAAVAKKKKKRGDKKKKDKNQGKGNGNGGGGNGPRCGQPACANQWPDDPENRNACEEKCGRCRIKEKFCIIPPDDKNPNLRATCCEEHQTCCPDHSSATGLLCVHLGSDSRHCGECNHECSDGQLCLGECIDPPPPPPRECMNCPAPNWKCCEGFQCVEVTSDRYNCGTCDNACNSGEQCINGACKPTCPDLRPQHCLVETMSGTQDNCIAAEDDCCGGYYCSWPANCCPGRKCSTLDGSCPD